MAAATILKKRKMSITPPLFEYNFELSSPNLVYAGGHRQPATFPYISFGLQQNPRVITPPPIGIGGRGIVFARFLCFFVSLFLSLFLCQQDYEKTAGPICVKLSGKVRSDQGTT